MLEEYQKIYKMSASYIPNWESQSKSELIINYTKADEEGNNQLKESYLSAIILKYWGAIYKYHRESSCFASEEDCYDWLIHSILYGINHKKWIDDNGLISSDINLPDKIINRCIKSTRLGFFQSLQYGKRSIIFDIVNLNKSLEEFCLEENLQAKEDLSKILNYSWISDIVNYCKKTLNLRTILILDGIINGNVIRKKSSTDKCLIFKKTALKKHILSIDLEYIKLICKLYTIDENLVKYEVKLIHSLTLNKFSRMIDSELLKIKKLIYQFADQDILQPYIQRGK